ncbi:MULTISPECIES: ATP-binding protein [unclassified Streptomyces]|uniref:ATP-binding protein n=1 Tax=unclassified Streptomyces TaxID=2593676 RepID=UPI000A4E246D|nr:MULTISPECIES: ATP-binding protein [unclassified Streptomyces]
MRATTARMRATGAAATGAAATGAAATGAVAGTAPRARLPWRARRIRLPWRGRSLRTRLLLLVGVTLAAVCAVLALTTFLVQRAYLLGNLDQRVTDAAERSQGGLRVRPGDDTDLGFLNERGQAVGTLAARFDDTGRVTAAEVVTGDGGQLRLTAAQRAALTGFAADGTPHTRTVPGLGTYRLTALGGDGAPVLTGLPMDDVQDMINRLVAAEAAVAAVGLGAAGVVCAVVIRRQLRPLGRVAATAVEVSRAPLGHGAVTGLTRVPDRDTDPGSEAGQVGAALNRMIDHVESSLAERQRGEERMRHSEDRMRRFLADASHELRTPLASIAGYAELMSRGAGAGTAVPGTGTGTGRGAATETDSGTATETGTETTTGTGSGTATGTGTGTGPGGIDQALAWCRVSAESARMTGLVEDLLLLARLDEGRPLRSAEVDLAALVAEAVWDARAAGGGHHWELALLPDVPALVVGDEARLHQVVANLLANARTHTPAGTTVAVSVESTATHRVVRVRDDGPGIPPAFLPAVFERFTRADGSRARATGDGAGGSGLGLAIVAAITAAHGGTIDVRSVPGHTEFTLALPAAAPADACALPAGRARPLAVAVPPPPLQVPLRSRPQSRARAAVR